MKKLITAILFLTLLLSLIGCSATPAETTVPTTAPVVTKPTETTVPPTTTPPTTEPEIPETYVCLNKVFEDAGITITVEDTDITLFEDGLTLTMSTENRNLCRDGYIMGVMKENPIISGEEVYIHGDFFHHFFCKRDTNQVSLFYPILFYYDEINAALKNPSASEFNARLCEEISLPSSMGITIPHVDPSRVFDDTPLVEVDARYYNELMRWGYKRSYTWSEYVVISQSHYQASSLQAPNEYDGLNIAEYNRLRTEQDYQELLSEVITKEEHAFFHQKGIDPHDFHCLVAQFGRDGMLGASDEELREAIETYYQKLLEQLGERVIKEIVPPNDAQIDAMDAYFEGMDEAALQKWFLYFAQKHCLDELFIFEEKFGPSEDASSYIWWLYEHNPAKEDGIYEISREYIEEMVLTHFGIVPERFHGDPNSWLYDPEKQVFSIFIGPDFRIKYSYFLLDNIEYCDGICTIHASEYAPRPYPESEEEEQQIIENILAGKRNGFTRTSQITVTFCLNPETNEPLFLSFDRIRNDDFPRI